MDEVFVEGFGVSVSKKSERLVVKRKGEIIFERPFFDVERVIFSTEGATISSSAIHECVKNGIPMEFISYSGRPYASLVSPNLGGTVKTRRAQLLAYDDFRGVELGKALATGKLKNSANNLKYYAKYRKGTDRAAYEFVYRRVDKVEDLVRAIAEIEGSCVDEARGALLNVEGRGAALYWEGMKRLVPDLPGRERRGARDLVNSLLNYGYGILYNRILSASTRAGLDPFAGYVHTDRPGKPSLVLDLIEESTFKDSEGNDIQLYEPPKN
jgi:CRISP-associated protein Cas1